MSDYTFNKNVDKIFEELYNIAKNKFSLSNISLTKTGITGYLIYTLAYLNEDAKYYYDFLYNESIPLTSTTFESLFKWGFMFGYTIQYATPAKFVGNILVYIPKSYFSNSSKVKIQIPAYSQFYYNDIVFTLFSDCYIDVDIGQGKVSAAFYDIEEQSYNTLLGAVIDESESYILIGVPALNVLQVEIVENEITVPSYPPGTSYEIPLEYDSESYQLAKLEVFTKLPDETDYVLNKLDSIKYLYSSTDRVVFISQKNQNEYSLILPDGVHGMYLPQGSSLKIKMYLTKGAAGNVAQNIYFKSKLNTKITINGEIVTEEDTVQLLTTAQLTSGKDVKTFEEIKNDIIKLIRTKNTLITNDDYIDFFGLDKSNVYVYRVANFVTDKSIMFIPIIFETGEVLQTVSLTIPETDLNPDNEYIVKYPRYTYKLKNLVYTGEYLVVSGARSGDTTIELNTIEGLSVGDRISILGEIYEIVGLEGNTVTIGAPLSQDVQENTQVYKVENETVELVSPFIYIKNDIRNSYDTFIEIDNLFKLNITDINENVADTLPQIKLYVSDYYYDSQVNNLVLKVSADIINSEELLYPPQIVITTNTGKRFILNSDNNFEVEITSNDITTEINQNDTLSEIMDKISEFSLNIELINSLDNTYFYKARGNINLFKNMSELITVNKYTDTATNTSYVIQVPFIDSQQFEELKPVIKDRLLNMLDIVIGSDEYRALNSGARVSFPNTIELNEPQYFIQPQTNTGECTLDNIRFPLKIKIRIIKNPNNIISDSDLLNIKIALVNYLKSKQSFYLNLPLSEITSVVKSAAPDKVLDVKVLYPSISLITKQNFESEYLKSKVSDDKLAPLKYNPVFYNFDLNDIDVEIV